MAARTWIGSAGLRPEIAAGPAVGTGPARGVVIGLDLETAEGIVHEDRDAPALDPVTSLGKGLVAERAPSPAIGPVLSLVIIPAQSLETGLAPRVPTDPEVTLRRSLGADPSPDPAAGAVIRRCSSLRLRLTAVPLGGREVLS